MTMPTQSSIEWDRDVSLPAAPSVHPAVRHASATGAQAGAVHFGAKVLLYLQLLAESGSQGLSDYEAAALMGRRGRKVAGVGSICSIRDKCKPLIEPAGSYETVTWANGFTSKRARWRRAKVGEE